MGLLNFFAARQSKALRASPDVLEAIGDRTFSPYPLIATPPSLRRINAVYVEAQNASYGWMYRTQPSVRRVVEYLASNVAQLGLKVYERVSDDEREHRGDHPAAELLRKPNPWTPGEQLIYELLSDYFIYDNAYALKIRTPEGNRMILRVEPPKVGLIGRSHVSAEAYRIFAEDGHSFDVPPEDMIHWRGYNPDDPRKGESKLETMREELAADLASRKAVTELHRSGLAFPGWLERPLDAPEWSEVGRKRFQEDASAQAMAGKRTVPVFEEGMQFKQGGVTPEDAQYLETRRWTVEQVAGMFGMENCPPKGEDQRKQFYGDVLPPITDRIAAFLGLQVLQQEFDADDHYFEFNLDEKLIGDDRLKALTSAAGAPPLTRNEARARLNLPAKPGGDELITPLNVTVGGKPSPQVMPIQDPNKPSQEGDARSEDEPTPPGKSLNGHHKAQLVPRRARTDERRNRWGLEYEDIYGSHFARQRRSMKGKNIGKAQAVKALESDRWDTDLAREIYEVSQRQFRSEGNKAAFRMAAEFDPELGANWLEAKALGSAKDINRVTREHVEERGIADAFAYAVGARAVAAGKGYATDIAGFAAKEAIKQAPDGDVRTVTIDGGECEICAPFQGSFPANDVPGWPGYHPNCGCVADIDGGGPPGGKSLQTQTQPVTIHNHVAPPNVTIPIQMTEGMFQVTTNVDPPPPAVTNVTTPDVNAQVTIEKGAVESVVNMEAPPPADVRTVIEKGAVQVDNPVNVEAPAPADIRFVEGAIQANVTTPAVNVEAPEAPNVNVEVKGGKTKKTVSFSDGRTADISDESTTKRTIKFSDGRTAEINESEEDEQRPDQD